MTKSIAALFAFSTVTLSLGQQSDLEPPLPISEYHAPTNPNHLEPIAAYDSDGYDQAVFRSFIGDQQPSLWMVSKPSFSPEHGFMILATHKWTGPRDPENLETTIFIESFKSKDQIWRWKELPNGRNVLDIQPTENVERERKEIDLDFGNHIFHAWEAVLKRTRYTDKNYRGTDGTTYQFFCRPYLYGEVWTPDSGLPLLIKNLGEKLESFIEADEGSEDRIREEAYQLASRIIEETK